MKVPFWAVVALIVALIFSTAGFAWAWRNAERDTRIAQANERAALDTTRVFLRDSVAAYSRLLIQGRIREDSLGEALATALDDRRATARALTRTRISLDSVTLLAQTPTVDTVLVAGADTVRQATFELQGPPIEGTQVVRVSRQITLDSRLSVTPFSVTYALGCADAEAVVSWSAPEWVRADFETGRVDPVVCNPLQPGLFRIDAGTGVWFGLGAVTTLVMQALLSR